MRILWITNIIFPVPCKTLGLQPNVFGGWMTSSLNSLCDMSPDMSYAVATVYNGDELKVIEDNSVIYYLLPSTKDNTCYDRSLESLWIRVKENFNPDIVHIHGTEAAHGLAYIRACGTQNVCVSIQGLLSVISRYYYAGMDTMDILKNISLRDILKMDTIFHQKRKFAKRGELEKEYIKSVSHIIGRTSWDKAHVWAINPDARYHFCNETLRPIFYNHKWAYDKCEKHTIFLSQATYPLKGLHKVLEAMPLILRHYPDAEIKVAGSSIIDRPFYKLTGYGKYIRSLIHKLHLEDKVTFLGQLSEEQMCEQYLKANVFICPSSIENSPNSLGEAQVLGVPSLSAYIGGAIDMMCGDENGLYRFEEIEMLAEKVISLFSDLDLSETKITGIAKKRHDLVANTTALVKLYNTIMSN